MKIELTADVSSYVEYDNLTKPLSPAEDTLTLHDGHNGSIVVRVRQKDIDGKFTTAYIRVRPEELIRAASILAG